MYTDYNKNNLKEKQAGFIKPNEKPTQKKWVTTTRLNLREKPDLNSNVVLILSFGETLKVDKFKDGWAHVSTKEGIEGYVVQDYIKEE